MNKVYFYAECQCGAITLYYDEKGYENNSVRKKDMAKYLPQSIVESIKYAPQLPTNKTVCCNHCVNHYGLDLCECGSGEHPQDCCKGGVREVLGESVKLDFNKIFR